MPEYVPAAIESLINDCWQTEADDRPSFLAIIEYGLFSLACSIQVTKLTC
jgi:hypothetical protein